MHRIGAAAAHFRLHRLDPAIEVLSCFEPPTPPLGFNELSIAGALRQRPVELAKCVSANEHAIAHAEYVTEREILPGSNHVVEDQNTHTGFAMPEFPSYNGHASHECWRLKVKTVTHRKHPIMLEFTALAWNGGESDGTSLIALRQKLKDITAQ